MTIYGDNMIPIKKLDFNKTVVPLLDNSKLIASSKVKAYDLITSFDIETTSTRVQGNKVGFMYIWMFAIEDVVICGRYWNEYVNLMNKITTYLHTSEDVNLICYIHNFSFEFQFMYKYFTWKNVFAVDSRKPIKALTDNGILYKDSYILSGVNLATVAKNLTNGKVLKLVGNLDYSKIRTSETLMTVDELDYCSHDVIIIIQYIREQVERYGNLLRIPLTNTGRVRNTVRDNCYYTKKSHKKSSTGKYFRYRKLMNRLTLDKNSYIQLKKAFQGGFTHANANHVNKTLTNISSFDFTSSYPTVMLSEKFPMSKPIPLEYDPKTFNDLLKEYGMVFDVKFINLRNKIGYESYLSESKCYGLKNKIINNGRVYSSDLVYTTITDIDFKIISKCYEWDDIDIRNILGFHMQYLPKEIIKSIIGFYKNKTKLKGLKSDRVEYMNSKAMLNSVYGMTVTDIVQDNNVVDDNGNWDVETVSIDDEIEKYNNSKKRFLYYPWGVWVTAYARRNLWLGIINVGNDYCYSDTDSLKIMNKDKHLSFIDKYNKGIKIKLDNMCKYYSIDPEELAPKNIKGQSKQIGIWDFEETYKKFKTLGAKRYIFTDSNNTLHITVAGLSKNNGAKYMLSKVKNVDDVFDYFNDDLYIPSSETGKLTHTYFNDEYKFKIKDFRGHTATVDVKSGINLEPCDFTLSISKEYGKFLQQISQGYIYKGVVKQL